MEFSPSSDGKGKRERPLCTLQNKLHCIMGHPNNSRKRVYIFKFGTYFREITKNIFLIHTEKGVEQILSLQIQPD
jgi:hypothetical protein